MDFKPLLVLGLVGALLGGGMYVNKSQREEAYREAGITTTAPDGPPVTSVDKATGDAADWAAGLERITRIENELYSAPNASRVGEIMLPACACYQDGIDRLNALKQKGRKVAGANIVLTKTTFIKQEGNSRVYTYTYPTSAGFGIVDSTGKTVEAAPPPNPKGFMYVMDKGTDGIWRLSDRYMIGTRQ